MMPDDAVLLLSYVNTLLRDRYDSLEELCASEGAELSGIEEKLRSIDYEYDRELNQFR